MAQSGSASAADRIALGHLERTKPRSYLSQCWYRFRSNKAAVAGLIVFILALCFGFGAPLISRFVTHHGFADQSLLYPFVQPFHQGYILGTDNLGRDVLTRLAYGTRVSMTIALVAVAAALTIGATLGSLAGFYGGWVDSVIMRFIDMLLAIPGLYLLILITALFTVGTYLLAFVIASLGWMGIARLIRGEILSVRQRPYVEAAKVVGVSDRRIIVRHILPNVLPIVIVWATLVIPGLIILEASLSFLGLGVQPPNASLGNMLNGAISFMSHSWTLVFIPGAMIFVVCLAINIFGNGLRDALDPRVGER